jgi:hypothetical protein
MGDLGGGDWREAVAEKGLAEADGGPDHLVIMVHGIVGRFGRFLCLADFPSIYGVIDRAQFLIAPRKPIAVRFLSRGENILVVSRTLSFFFWLVL